MATTQITKNGVTKDIHDRRLPTTIGTEGQILQVNNQGQIVWNDAPEGSVTNVKVDGTSVVTEGVAEIDLGDFSITATAEELNVLDGITATTEELNYTDGVTSAIQPQLNTLDTRISNLQNIGRFLSILDAANGTVSSQPTGSVGDTYAYKVGDYYRIGTAGTYTPKNTLTFTIDATSGSSNFEQGTITYSIGDVIYCSNVGESATTWVKQASSGGGTVQDVQINSQSLVSGGIATIPIASTSGPGVIKYTQGQGLSMAADKSLYVVYAVPAEIEAKTNKRNCITPGYLDKAVMEGLGNNSLTWSDEYKASARTRIGAISASDISTKEDTTNKVTTITSSSTDTQYPSAKAVWDTEQEIKEIAEGKTKSFVSSIAKTSGFNSQDDLIELTQFVTTDDAVIGPSQVHKGDNVYITDTDVPDRWVSGFRDISSDLPTGYVRTSYNESTGIGTLVLDGTENWTKYSMSTVTNCYSMPFSGYIATASSQSMTYSSHFQNYWFCWTNDPSGYGGYTFHTNGSNLYIKTGDLVESITDLASWKAYLAAHYAAGTPVTIYYPLATAVTTPNKIYGSTGGAPIASTFVPCYRASDNVAGLYDITHSTFITSLGDATFTAGPDAPTTYTIQLSKLETAKVPVTNVKIGNDSIVTNTVATIPNANGNTLGVVRAYGTRKFNVSDGYPYCDTITYSDWSGAMANSFISKGSLDNVVAGSLVRFDAATSLTDTQKTQARSNVGALGASDITGKEDSSNKVTSITSSSTDTQYPSAAAVYGLVIGAIEGEY